MSSTSRSAASLEQAIEQTLQVQEQVQEQAGNQISESLSAINHPPTYERNTWIQEKTANEKTVNEKATNEKIALELRRIEALIFASHQPMSVSALQEHLTVDVSLDDILNTLVRDYKGRGVELVHTAGGWQFRTASDLSGLLTIVAREPKKLSRVALETLAIVAYHQPVTRAEIEDIRGVSTMRGTLDTLLETGWVRLRGRRKTIGRPVTYGTTPAFLIHFGLENLSDLPGLDELKGAGFIEGRVPAHVRVPTPSDDIALTFDEEPLDGPEAPLPEAPLLANL